MALLSLTDNVMLDGMLTNVKLKIQACFTLYFKFSVGISVESYKIHLPVLLFLDSHHISKYHFLKNFLELHSTLSEKEFYRKFFFFNGFI